MYRGWGGGVKWEGKGRKERISVQVLLVTPHIALASPWQLKLNGFPLT
jgi:hypothetical protein